MSNYTEDEKRFLISMEEKYGSLCPSMEEMAIKAYRDGQKMARDAMAKEKCVAFNELTR